MRATQRLGVFAGSVVLLIACREIPAPAGGVFSLSPVRLPSPGVVAGDTMRDSTGNVAPLVVIAYGLDGEPLPQQPPFTFIVADTGAHFDGALLIGDSVGVTVKVLGSVGKLQSQQASVFVTVEPDTLIPADSVIRRVTYSLVNGDTVATSSDLAVLVRHLSPVPSGVQAVIVNYTIDRAPPGNGTGPTAVLMNGNVRSARDTTDNTGRAARTVRLRLLALGAPTGTDTVEVSATASYRGQILGIVQFTIIFTNQ